MNASERLTIRAAGLDDANEILGLVHDRPCKRALWEWETNQNPTHGPFGHGLVACEGDRVVGCNGAMAVAMLYRQGESIGNWSVDSFVHPAYRGRGVASRLKDRLEATLPLMALGSSPAMLALYLKRKWQRSTQIAEYFYQCRPTNLRALGRLVLQRTARHLPALRRDWQAMVLPIADVLGEVQGVWDQAASGYESVVCRTEAYIKWKYVEHPNARYESISIKNEQGATAAIGIFRRSQETSRLVDYIGPRYAQAAKDLIVAQFVDACHESNRLHSITTDREFKQSLEAHGFRAYPEPTSFCVCQADGDVNAEDWFVMAGDSDGDLLDAASESESGR